MRIGYARVSTKEQAENSRALKNQEDRLWDAKVDEVLTDVESRTNNRRKNFLKLHELVEKNKVREIIVTRIDRLSGDLLALLELAELCDRHNCKISPLDEKVDTQSPIGLLQFSMSGAISAYQVRLIRQKIKQGYEARRKRHAANPQAPYGYVVVDEKYQLNPNTLEVAHATVNTYIETRSLTSTIKIIYEKHGKSWSMSGLRNWMLNPVLLGHTPYKNRSPRTISFEPDEIIYNTHPDQILLTEQKKKEIKDILLHNIEYWGANSKPSTWINPFSGLIYCCGCKRTVDMISKKRKDHILRYTYCRTRSGRIVGETCSMGKCCNYEKIEEEVTESLIMKASIIANLVNQEAPVIESPTILKLQSEINQLQFINNPSNAILAAIADLNSQLDKERSLSSMTESTTVDIQEELVKVFGDRVFWELQKEQLTPHKLQSMYRQFVDKIWIKNGRVDKIDLKM